MFYDFYHRVNKQIILSNGKEVPYDHLILCTGQQFQYPVPTGVDITSLVTTSEAKKQKKSKVLFCHEDRRNSLFNVQCVYTHFLEILY